ncbi:TIGR04255 family protein [Alcaligenaceae bacterium B3P038]|nr:TIGR04255 family protein [Alcaligenaceae bacterium B3P038]
MSDNGRGVPVKLGEEPLIDAIFELRFSSSLHASNVFPGALMIHYKEQSPTIERLPIADLPQQLREQDPDLQYQAHLRILLPKFFVLIGDRVLGLACRLPYSGWSQFKQAILELLHFAHDLALIQDVERCSLKYVDLLPGADVSAMRRMVKLGISIADHTLDAEGFQLRTQIANEPFVNVMQIGVPTTVQLVSGPSKTGLLIDTDVMPMSVPSDFSEFLASADDLLEGIHSESKRFFFGMLTEHALQELKAEYE